MSLKPRERIWWMGVVFVTGIVSWLPYWAWNALGGVQEWWRVPVVTPGLFDTYVYLHWMGAAAYGLSYGGHLKWFGLILRALWSVMGRVASIPELWIVSRWLTFGLTLSVSAWVYERWGGLSRGRARGLAIAFFGAVVLTLGIRPGIYAWYMPFAAASLICVFFAGRALDSRRLLPAVAWSVASIVLGWIYPWFFLFSGFWLAALWGIFVARLRPWALPAVAAIFSCAAALAGVPLAHWFLDPARAALVGVYERNGMVFARVPFFANTVLAIGAWIVLCVVLARRETGASRRASLVFLGGGWIAMLLLWFHTLFTGIFTYSDHLISPVVVFAWISLAVVWHWADKVELRDEPFALFRWLPGIMAAGAVLFFLYILQQPLRGNVLKFDSYVVHLAHWLALAVAASLAAWKLHRPTRAVSAFAVMTAALIAGFGVGIGGWLPAFIRDIPRVPGLQQAIPVISWIRQNTLPADRLCGDPASASFYAAHTGRYVFPSEATLSWPDSSAAVIAKLKTIVGAYNVRASGTQDTFQFFTDHYRTIACANESKYSHNAPYARILSKLGLNADQVNDLIGCDVRTLDANRAAVQAASDAHQLDVDAFRELCPSVIVSEDQKPFWTLPTDYVEHRITSTLSVWQTP